MAKKMTKAQSSPAMDGEDVEVIQVLHWEYLKRLLRMGIFPTKVCAPCLSFHLCPVVTEIRERGYSIPQNSFFSYLQQNVSTITAFNRRSLSEDNLLDLGAPCSPSDKARCHYPTVGGSHRSSDVTLTPRRIGEVMSMVDPHYRPGNGAMNPFATFVQFRDGRKILATSKELFSSCFELPSPSSLATPPFTPNPSEDVTPRPLFFPVRKCQISRSSSLPGSPNCIRRVLQKKTSASTTGCTSPLPPDDGRTMVAEDGLHCTHLLLPHREEEYAYYGTLRRRGSCESGFFSVGDGERTSTSDLSPDPTCAPYEEGSSYGYASLTSSSVNTESELESDTGDMDLGRQQSHKSLQRSCSEVTEMTKGDDHPQNPLVVLMRSNTTPMVIFRQRTGRSKSSRPLSCPRITCQDSCQYLAGTHVATSTSSSSQNSVSQVSTSTYATSTALSPSSNKVHLGSKSKGTTKSILKNHSPAVSPVKNVYTS